MTSPEPLPPPPVPLPCPEVPAFPHPYPDFTLPEDAFALELRAESIEQLIGGDALRRGESERIEAGRSSANTDLVAGRDRVRVQGRLDEHTGRGLAEQAAHLETTVGGALDIHAATEDTVMLAGHMKDAWNGGTAVVGVMSDDLAAGGGVRTTAPLDLWLHGLMGVEERAGTCTADAVLAELYGTLYEREYGPGVHAAGIAVFNGTLYQSARSQFRPLMRISSGVRNLIAGGGGGDAGGGAPPASSPPAPAGTGAAPEAGAVAGSATQAATGTLAAGRRAAEVPETALDVAGGLIDAPRAVLDDLLDSIDAPVAGMGGQSGTAAHSVDLSELTRSADTAEQLGALQDTLRLDEAGDEATGGYRVTELGDTASVHEACALDPVPDIRPPVRVPELDTPAPQSGSPQRSGMKLGLLGGAPGDPPQSTARQPDWRTLYRRLYHGLIRSREVSNGGAQRAFGNAYNNISYKIEREFRRFHGRVAVVFPRGGDVMVAEKRYSILQEMAREAEQAGDTERASQIRKALEEIDQFTRMRVNRLAEKYDVPDEAVAWMTQPSVAMVRQPVVAPSLAIPAPPVTVGQMMAQAGHWDVSDLTRPIVLELNPAFSGPAGGLVNMPDAPGPAPLSSLSGPSLPGAAGTDAGGFERWMLDPGAGTSAGAATGGTASYPVDTGAVATPQLGAESTFWLRPAEPAQSSGTVRFDTGVQRAGLLRPPGETVHRPHTAAPASVVDPGPVLIPPWVRDDYAVERALNAGRLPADFDASALIGEWDWLAVDTQLQGQLQSGLLPTRTIDWLIEHYRVLSRNTDCTFMLHSLQNMKDSVVRALAAAYPGRTGQDWLAVVEHSLETLGIGRGAQEGVSVSVAVSRHGEEVVEAAQASSRPAPLESTVAAGRTEVGAGARPAAGDPWRPWRTEPPGMRGEPHPVRFGQTETVPGAGTGVVYTTAMPPRMPSVVAPPGFARLTSGSGEVPFSRREEIVRRFLSGGALREAELAIHDTRPESLGSFGWPAAQQRAVLSGLSWLQATALASPRTPRTVAEIEVIDWGALDALMRILDAPAHSA